MHSSLRERIWAQEARLHGAALALVALLALWLGAYRVLDRATHDPLPELGIQKHAVAAQRL